MGVCILTKPRIGSIIRYPYWMPSNHWFVLEHQEYADGMEQYITAYLIGGAEGKETLSAYVGEEMIDSNHSDASCYWEYVE